MQTPIAAGPEEFHHCPWSEVTDLSIDLISAVNRWRQPYFKGWDADEYPQIVDDVTGVYVLAEADMEPFIQDAHRARAKKAAERN